MAPARHVGRRPATLLLALLVVLLVGSAPASAAEEPYRVVVEPTSGLVDRSTVIVTVDGGLAAAVGLSIVLCPESAVVPMPDDAADLVPDDDCDGPGVWALGSAPAYDRFRGEPGTVELAASRHIEVEVSARFDTDAGVVDCRSASCGIAVFRDRFGTEDRSYDAFVPLTYRAGHPFGVWAVPTTGLVDGASVTVMLAGEVPRSVGLSIALCPQSAVVPMPTNAGDVDPDEDCAGPGVWALGAAASYDPYRGGSGTVELEQTRRVTVPVTARLETAGGTIDCRKVACGIAVFRDGFGPKDRGYDAWVPLTFVPPPPNDGAPNPPEEPEPTPGPEAIEDGRGSDDEAGRGTAAAPASSSAGARRDIAEVAEEEPPGTPVVIEPIVRSEAASPTLPSTTLAPTELETSLPAVAPTALPTEEESRSNNAGQVALMGLVALAMGGGLMRMGRKQGRLAAGA